MLAPACRKIGPASKKRGERMSVELTSDDGARVLRRIERWLAVIAICFVVIAASAAFVAYEASSVGENLSEMRQDRLARFAK
jgi:hypothetical protein